MKHEINYTRKFAVGDRVQYLGIGEPLTVTHIVAVGDSRNYAPHNRLEAHSEKDSFRYWEACEDFFQNIVTAYR